MGYPIGLERVEGAPGVAPGIGQASDPSPTLGTPASGRTTSKLDTSKLDTLWLDADTPELGFTRVRHHK